MLVSQTLSSLHLETLGLGLVQGDRWNTLGSAISQPALPAILTRFFRYFSTSDSNMPPTARTADRAVPVRLRRFLAVIHVIPSKTRQQEASPATLSKYEP